MSKGEPYTQKDIKIITDWMMHLRSRPGMYLGEASLKGLRCLFEGVRMAELYHEVRGSVYPSHKTKPSMTGFMFDFHMWFNKKFKKVNSWDYALEQCNKDDKEAFYLWFDWYTEFRESTNAKN